LAPARKRLAILLTLGALIWALAGGASPAAASLVSPESPASPNAEEMTTLYWVGFIVAVLTFIAINVALIGVIRRFRARRGREAEVPDPHDRGGQLKVGGALTALALLLFIVGIVFTERAREVPAPGPDSLQASSTLTAQKSIDIPEGDDAPLRIRATAQQWLWRFDYPRGGFSYHELVVPVDTPVVLDLVSTDVAHSFFVPELSGKFDAVPGKVNKVVFRADEEGTYEGSSATFSGQGYASMRITVTVVPATEYEAYVDELASGILEAQERVIEEQGGVNEPGED
jgi:heme/copper-type cytochrome/quinol oxidase subunit 2